MKRLIIFQKYCIKFNYVGRKKLLTANLKSNISQIILENVLKETSITKVFERYQKFHVQILQSMWWDLQWKGTMHVLNGTSTIWKGRIAKLTGMTDKTNKTSLLMRSQGQ